MNGPTRDSPARKTTIPDVEDAVFWDAYWTLDEEWNPDSPVTTSVAAPPRATAAVRETGTAIS